jgi:hypothetical protein
LSPETLPTEQRKRWLVVGHGSVGSFVAARIARSGHSVKVFDPDPRIPLLDGIEPAMLTGSDQDFDCVASCVPPAVAESIPSLLRGCLHSGGFFFDWNTLSPPVKMRIKEALSLVVIDVALLDSLDASVERPSLAISGPRIAEGAKILRELGFTVAVAGDQVGQAAALKYLRSIFMKTLEGLILEYAALSADLDGNSIVRDSIAKNLGVQFADFMDLLLRTNRIHAERRSQELADAIAMFSADGVRPVLAAAGVEVLRRSADAWRDLAAPPPGSDPLEFATYLQDALWQRSAST